MDTTIKAVHFDITEKLTEFINKKVDRLARRYQNIIGVDVTLNVIKPETSLNKQALIKVDVPQEEVVAEKTADTFEEAVDVSLEAVERQLERIKNRK
ncbi:MAG: ribosome-associated translation inhibitor RaiA [Lachnoclostridium sp.]|nr:ribosome-associated translation inhibitor RaiA [Lachnoclostridium sp.]